MALANKILTWDNLQKRGWIGPGCCALCGNGEDSVQHLFTSCAIWKNLIANLSDLYHFLPPQLFNNLSSFLGIWIASFSKHSVFLYLPFFAIWAIWKERNRLVFEGKKPYFLSLIQQIVYYSQM